MASATSSAELASPLDRGALQPGRLATLRELAPILRMSEVGIRSAVNRGLIPAMRFGAHGRLLFDLSAVRAALQQVGPSSNTEAGGV
jgi:hypothetical protein